VWELRSTLQVELRPFWWAVLFDVLPWGLEF